MKQLLLIPVVFLAACASRSARTITIHHTEPSRGHVAPLRHAENIREYRLGRFADPRDPRVMHESHPVYRIETDARWNLSHAADSAPSQKQPGATKSVSTNDAVVAEVNKQRTATKAFIEQTTTLNQRLGELSTVAGESHELARQNLILKRDLAALQDRLDALETRTSRPKASEPAPSKPATEDKW